MKRTKTQETTPSDSTSLVSAERAQKPREEFADVLRSKMRERNLTAADLSRAIQAEIPAFSPGNISHYLAGRSLPRNHVLKVLSQMLEVDLQDYALLDRKPLRVASRAAEGTEKGEVPKLAALAALAVSDAGDGQALVQINQTVPWPIALQILQIFKGG
ncbi:hypothetical protein [Methylobacterium planeticum]|uniref:Uncharacterized protein n=1 Tax=Methylobacterium planeticum TaxID=2615211 RepID=A0A6N6MGZ5_9HYPH|nr:hypothetical protein [Methylobacterium planeticum]KAB1069568.1 hypothetical protein F6X51_24985 [Methylobacterium planeticum]